MGEINETVNSSVELDNETPHNQSNMNSSDDSTSASELSTEWLDILGSGHLKKRVLTTGKEGSRPERGDICILNIKGSLENGDVFDEQNDVSIILGDGDVIQGIDYCLPLMDEGEVSEVMISPRFGYGSLGDPPLIPKDATIIYTIHLLEVKGPPNIPEMSMEERLKVGLRKKERGNWWFVRKDFNSAIQSYRIALKYLGEDNFINENDFNDARLKVYNNLTISQLNVEAYDAALTSVNHVLLEDADNVKALFRKVKILKAKGEVEMAIEVAKYALKIKPDSKAFQDELNVLLESKKKSLAAQKKLYRKMFERSSKSSERKKGIEMTFALKWFGLFTFAAGILGAVIAKYKS